MVNNNVMLIGRITKPIELRKTAQGISVCGIDLAIDNGKNKDGSERDPLFIKVNCWDKLAEIVAQYSDKGMLVAVSGRLILTKWTDKNGQNREAVEVVADGFRMLERKRESQQVVNTPTLSQKIEKDDAELPF